MLSSIIIVITLSKTIITIKQQQCSSLCFLSTAGAGVQFEFKTFYRSLDQNQLVDIVSVCTRRDCSRQLSSHPHFNCSPIHKHWHFCQHIFPRCVLSLSKFVVFSRWFPRVFPFLISTNPPFPRSISQGHCTMGDDLNTSPDKSKLQNQV